MKYLHVYPLLFLLKEESKKKTQKTLGTNIYFPR